MEPRPTQARIQPIFESGTIRIASSSRKIILLRWEETPVSAKFFPSLYVWTSLEKSHY